MNTTTSPQQLRTALRRLTVPHALAFGNRLLRSGDHSTITFREFIDAARDLIAQLPEQSAVYLAALVALDMANEDYLLSKPTEPSPN
jgi:hypothetical protein